MFVGGSELQLCFSEVPISFLSIIVPLLFGLDMQFSLCNYFHGINDIFWGFGEYKNGR